MPAPPHPALPLTIPRRPTHNALPLLLQAFAYMLAARVALRLFPATRIQHWQSRPVLHPNTTDNQTVEIVAWAILTAARRSPIHLVCFPQALAASAMLRARHIPTRLHYGAARIEGRLTTHVWLEAAGQIVIGGGEAPNFSTLAIYQA